MSERTMRGKILAMTTVLLLVLFGMGAKLVRLHAGEYGDLRTDVEKRQSHSRRLLAGRGAIYDRRGRKNLLAGNLAVRNVCANPLQIVSQDRTRDVAAKVSRELGMPAGDVAALIVSRPKAEYVCLGKHLRQELADRIVRQGPRGLFTEDAIVRHYPQAEFMCHVLGFVNHEGAGSAGAERYFDSFLRGCPGLVEGAVDARRREIRRASFVPPIQGGDVFLTLDQNIQYMVENALDEVMARCHPLGAWAIVQSVRTGEILAMATRPAFDPNQFRCADTNHMLNRAIGYRFEPGSTLKAATIAAALEHRTVTPDTVFDCENGQWWYANRPLRDHGRNGDLTVADGLKRSSNILTAKVALTLGRDRLHRAMWNFGLGHKMGVDLPGEETGCLWPAKDWAPISVTRIAIGQGVAVTAMQMLGVFSAIANDGFLMRPYVVGCVLGPNGAILAKAEPHVLGRPISRETAATMRRLLARVTEDGGTGARGRVEGWTVAGKTGTSQKPEAGGYSNTRHWASFVGFAPVERPELAAIVVVDEPQGKEYFGGQVAAPAFGRIMEQALRYLDVPNDGHSVVACASR
jgi:cell division protein FtsI (penicillin-binding protein 3)